MVRKLRRGVAVAQGSSVVGYHQSGGDSGCYEGWGAEDAGGVVATAYCAILERFVEGGGGIIFIQSNRRGNRWGKVKQCGCGHLGRGTAFGWSCCSFVGSSDIRENQG